MTKYRVLLEAETEIEVEAENEHDAIGEALANLEFRSGFREQNWRCVGTERIE